jgi:NDP-sugar pyrophosphorylase family protein
VATGKAIVRAMILAAGEGTRLSPITVNTPKAILPIGAIPLIVHQLLWLKSYGIHQVAINLHHLGDRITELLGDGSNIGMSITYSSEAKLLGTAGGVKKVENFFGGTFVVLYGDVLADFNLEQMMHFHWGKKSMATMVLSPVDNPSEAGIVQIDSQGRILDFVEKPGRDKNVGNLANGGIYILEKAVISNIPDNGYCDFAYDVFPKMLELGVPVYGYALAPTDYLIDIGTIDKYRKANEDVEAGKIRIRYGRLDQGQYGKQTAKLR